MPYMTTLEEMVRQDNFYRRLKKAISMEWLYKAKTKKAQHSIYKAELERAKQDKKR
ncbi:hypothetical protein BH10BAC2_BH10BAC2_21290 [soil metagenome]